MIMDTESPLEFICAVRKNYPQCIHASNIIKKYKTKGLKSSQMTGLEKLMRSYAVYLEEMLEIQGFDDESIRERVACLNRYYNFMHGEGLDNLFSSQGKFRPTVLEEFLYLLFKDYVEAIKKEKDKDNVIGSGSVKAYSNLYFKARNFDEFIQSPVIGVNQKDQDYAIYRIFSIAEKGGTKLKINIPAIAIEAKTYIDKTMLDSIMATAEKIKSGNPHTRFVAVTESYDVSLVVDPAYSRIDQIYVLRKMGRKEGWRDIDPEVVLRLFHETVDHLERPWSDVETKLRNDGVVI